MAPILYLSNILFCNKKKRKKEKNVLIMCKARNNTFILLLSYFPDVSFENQALDLFDSHK
jgi:hypothetical protein